MADLSILISDLQEIYEEGSNDSKIMATKMATAFDKYCMSLKVKKGINTQGTGTGNLGLPVSVKGSTISLGDLE